MSTFGDWNKDQLHDDIERYFNDGGTLTDFFDVLTWYTNDKSLNTND